jgi:hypothetical protein
MVVIFCQSTGGFQLHRSKLPEIGTVPELLQFGDVDILCRFAQSIVVTALLRQQETRFVGFLLAELTV